MGLDVYLYHYQDPQRAMLLLRKYEELAEHIWQGTKDEDATEAERRAGIDARSARCRAVAESLGLDKYGDLPESMAQRIELPSRLYPEHLFKIGYLRSSYNDGGLNTVLRAALDRDLYWVFAASEQYRFAPDWKASLDRARQLHADYYLAHLTNDGFRVKTLRHNPFISKPDVGNEHSALEVFLKERQTHQERHKKFPEYSNRQGIFYQGPEPLKVRAIITGVGQGFDGEQHPVHYLVYEYGDWQWYAQALEITAEMCAWVLEQPDPANYLLHWSG